MPVVDQELECLLFPPIGRKVCNASGLIGTRVGKSGDVSTPRNSNTGASRHSRQRLYRAQLPFCLFKNMG